MLSTFRTSTPALYSEKCLLILYTTFSKLHNLYVLNKSRIVNSLKDSQVLRYVFKNKNYIVSKQCMENNLWWRHSSRDSPWVLPRNSHVAYCYTNNHKASSHLVAMQMVGIISSKFLLNTCTCYILAINFEHLQTCLLSFSKINLLKCYGDNNTVKNCRENS